MLSLKPSKKPLKEGISMRKSLLAMAALMGISTLPAHAWRVNIDKETFADIGFSTIVRGTYEGNRNAVANERSRLNFYVPLFNITAGGQVNELVYFGMNLEGAGAGAQPVVRDSFIGLRFAEEFRLQAGLQRAPFSRAALTSTYVQLFPYHPGMGILVNPTNVETGAVNPRDAGIVVWGNVADGMVKYYLGITDGATIGSAVDDSLATTIRIQFTPVMAGFKPETGYTLADTYLGRQNVLSIGAGYRTVGRSAGNQTTNMFTVDLLYENKFGDAVPNFQAGYINKQNANNTAGLTATQIYAQAGILYDQMVGVGKPAGAIRFERNSNEQAGQTATLTRFGVWGHYYIKGQAAKVSLGFDSVSCENNACPQNYTDLSLQLQTQF